MYRLLIMLSELVRIDRVPFLLIVVIGCERLRSSDPIGSLAEFCAQHRQHVGAILRIMSLEGQPNVAAEQARSVDAMVDVAQIKRRSLEFIRGSHTSRPEYERH